MGRVGITERVVFRILLEFHMNVDERDVGYDGGISTTARYIERNIRFDFGFDLAEVHVRMAVGIHKIEARTVTLQRFDLEDS